jgi:hypothetical protein
MIRMQSENDPKLEGIFAFISTPFHINLDFGINDNLLCIKASDL